MFELLLPEHARSSITSCTTESLQLSCFTNVKPRSVDVDSGTGFPAGAASIGTRLSIRLRFDATMAGSQHQWMVSLDGTVQTCVLLNQSHDACELPVRTP